MSARARIHAMLPTLLDNSPAETEARTAELNTRINELATEVRREDAALLTRHGFHLPADLILRAAHDTEAGAAPVTPTTNLHQTLLDAVQSFRSSLQAESSWSQQFAAHLMAAIAQHGDGHTPDFFQRGRTYTEPDGNTDWRFRCDAITTHPATGERTALGWLHFRGEWSECSYGVDDFEIHQIADAIGQEGDTR